MGALSKSRVPEIERNVCDAISEWPGRHQHGHRKPAQSGAGNWGRLCEEDRSKSPIQLKGSAGKQGRPVAGSLRQDQGPDCCASHEEIIAPPSQRASIRMPLTNPGFERETWGTLSAARPGFHFSLDPCFPNPIPKNLTVGFDPAIYLNSPWCSGSAVQLRHYPVTVSAESKAPAVCSHWTNVWEGDAWLVDAQVRRPARVTSLAVFRSRWEDRR